MNPCPVCGDSAFDSPRGAPHYRGTLYSFICSGCGFEGPEAVNVKEAVAKWDLQCARPLLCPHCNMEPRISANSFSDSTKKPRESRRWHRVFCVIGDPEPNHFIWFSDRKCSVKPSAEGTDRTDAVGRWNRYVISINSENEIARSDRH